MFLGNPLPSHISKESTSYNNSGHFVLTNHFQQKFEEALTEWKNMVAMISGCDRYCQGGQNRYFLGGTRLGLGVAIGVLPLQDTLSARDDHSFAQKKYIIRSCVKKTKYENKNALEVKYYS